MARIAGVDLPREKRVEIGLTYIYGIGLTTSQKLLAEEEIDVAVVSMPSMEVFEQQSAEYKESVLPKYVPSFAVEAGVTLGWTRYTKREDRVLGIDTFGASAPGGVVAEHYGMTDDLAVYGDNGEQLATLHHLRQQTVKTDGKPNFSLADFVAPKETGITDYVGGFITTAGIGAEEVAKAYQDAGDDYNSIMVKALADRLAEAFAERLHQRVRIEFWGYAADEALDNEALIAERYRGIRPAPGYPACPEHSEKQTLFRLLDAQRNAGMTLTESFAMLPTAAVSGYYFSHPRSQYFVVGRVSKEQAQDYARRKGVELAQVERWLASNLDYDPE